MFKSRSINFLDVILNSSFWGLFFNYIYIIACCNEKYKLYLNFIFLIILIILILVRIILINKKIQNRKVNVYDLKYLCTNKVNVLKGDLILLEEQDVSYDLLNRGNIINQIFNTIIKCEPQKNFTLGIDGKWGSGKTTIINNVFELIKKNGIEDLFLIVKFDPWEYDNEKAILKGLIDQILYNMNLDFKIEDIDSLVDSFIDIVFYNSPTFLNKILKTQKLKQKIKIENIINNYLNNQNKKMILVIDNLDRIDSSKINFLLKCISTVIDFENTIIVLLYDENIIEGELKELFGTRNNNNKYMEKIVQLKIGIPPIDSSAMENIKHKISQNLTFNGKQIMKNILTDEIDFDTIRALKRFLNFVFSSIDEQLNFLNYSDLINLEFIRNKNPELYYDIWNKKTFYISDDRKYDNDLYTLNNDVLNNNAIDYFDKLFSIDENKKYQDVLSSMFPNVKNYLDYKKVFDSNYIDRAQYREGITECRIYNARYFDLYFTKSNNIFIKINNDVLSLIKIINKGKKEEYFKSKLDKIISEYSADELKVFMEVFEISINKISHKNYLNVICAIYDILNRIPNRPIFFGLDSKERCEIIITKILTLSTNDVIKSFCQKISKDYNKIHSLSQIIYWLSKEETKNQFAIDMITEKYNSICNEIYVKNINLYSSKNYIYSNIWGLYHYDKIKIIKYIENNINGRNIFRFLNDVVSHSVGTNGYGYSIKKSNIDVLGPNLDIDKLIINHKRKLTEDELFIKKLYEMSKMGETLMEDEIFDSEYKDIKTI